MTAILMLVTFPRFRYGILMLGHFRNVGYQNKEYVGDKNDQVCCQYISSPTFFTNTDFRIRHTALFKFFLVLSWDQLVLEPICVYVWIRATSMLMTNVGDEMCLRQL